MPNLPFLWSFWLKYR